MLIVNRLDGRTDSILYTQGASRLKLHRNSIYALNCIAQFLFFRDGIISIIDSVLDICTACPLIFAWSLYGRLLERYLFFGLWSSEKNGGVRVGNGEHGSKLARHERVKKNVDPQPLQQKHKLQVKYNGHAVCMNVPVQVNAYMKHLRQISHQNHYLCTVYIYAKVQQ